MKRVIFPLLLACGLHGSALALPNSILGPLATADSPLNGEDLTGELLAAAVWDGAETLPGEWVEEG